jgi:flavin-dependent dehydrogenase
MAHSFNADVLIVGAGPVGSYLGWKLAQSGCDVMLLEALPLKKVGAHIEVIHVDQIRFNEFEIPHPLPPEKLHLVHANKVWSVDGSSYFNVEYPFYIVNMPAFVQRLHGYILQSGGRIIENARVNDIILKDGFCCGVSGICAGEPFEEHAKITIDASGITGAVRTHLPRDFGVENCPVPPEQTFYCALELRDQIPSGFPTDNNTFLGAPGFWNKSYGDGVILGIIAPGSVETAWNALTQWRESTYGNPGRLVANRAGCSPYRRAPVSYVGNGFAGVGDSVYQNKAFSGEGITSGFTACKIAKEVIVDALMKNDVSLNGLWDYNIRYFHGQGAKFAGVMVFLFPVNGLPKSEVDYLYQHKIIFCAEDYEYLNLNYELNLPPERWEAICQQLKQGIQEGKFSENSYQLMNTLYNYSAQLKAHYLTYPETPEGLPAWSAITRNLWGY